jgi:uncharacterized membrane protein
MDLTPYLGWLRLIHVAGAFLFVAGHGTSIAVAFRMRRERDPQRLLALLDLSAWSLSLAGVGLLFLLVGGIVAGIVAGSFGRGWIWVSLVLFIVIGGAMTPLGGMYFNRVRLALGQRPARVKLDADPVPQSADAITALMANRRPEWLTLIGGGGFLAILWLMMFKPF